MRKLVVDVAAKTAAEMLTKGWRLIAMVMLLLLLTVAQTLPPRSELLPPDLQGPSPALAKRMDAERMASEVRSRLLLPISRVRNPNPLSVSRTEREMIMAAANAAKPEAFLGDDKAFLALLKALERLRTEASLRVLKAIGMPRSTSRTLGNE